MTSLKSDRNQESSIAFLGLFFDFPVLVPLSRQAITPSTARFHRTYPNFIQARFPICARDAGIFLASSIIPTSQLTIGALNDKSGIASAFLTSPSKLTAADAILLLSFKVQMASCDVGTIPEARKMLASRAQIGNRACIKFG